MEQSTEKIEFLRNFIGRQDSFASREGSKKGYSTQKRPIQDEDLRRHLTEYGPHIATYLMSPGSEDILHAVFDLDDHDGTGSWHDMQETGRLLHEELVKYGFMPIPFRSGGGHGIHLWLLWEEPQNAYDVRVVMNDALASIGFTNGANGIANKEIEIFPKQDRVPNGQFGSAIALPLARNSRPLCPKTYELKG